MSLDRDTVLASLCAADVAAHYGITGAWRGRWLRSSRCAVADHGSEAFGISQDGRFHCWACDTGGDLLKLIALGEKLDIRNDFPAVLSVAAAIAGVEDDESFGGGSAPAHKVRAPLPAVAPLADRIALAKRRAAWAWDRLHRWDEIGKTVQWGDPGRHSVADQYLAQERGLDPRVIRAREDLRETPLRCTMEEMCKSPDMKSLSYLFAVPGVALPVRCVTTGALVDIRIRRFEPREGQPKIIGMLGGVTTGAAEGGRTRQLVGCYGKPHVDMGSGPGAEAFLGHDLVVIVEGALDYLTALQLWPEAHVLGAVDAGSLGLVAAYAARQIVDNGNTGRLLIVEQNDGAGAAADRSVNEDPNAAAKVAVRLLGPKRVGWLFCSNGAQGNYPGLENHDLNSSPKPVKDLNDLLRVRGPHITRSLVKWWVDL